MILTTIELPELVEDVDVEGIGDEQLVVADTKNADASALTRGKLVPPTTTT